MSILINKNQETNLNYNEEAFILREIFNIIKAQKENKKIESKKIPIVEKYTIKNIKIENLNNIEAHPKNRYKSKLQKIFTKKKCNN